MPLLKPYRRTVRPFSNGSYYDDYIGYPNYATAGGQYIRAFLLIQKDLLEIFEFIEPAKKNLLSYSFRIHELLMRTCIEVEANFKAILNDNDFFKEDEMKINNAYYKVNKTHRLSDYEIEIVNWIDKDNQYTSKKIIPFGHWKNNCKPLFWYQAYNKSKHDRNKNFHKASLLSLIFAVSALTVLITSQFLNFDYSANAGEHAYGFGRDYYGYTSAIGDYFRVKYPLNWLDEDMYEYDRSFFNQNPEYDKHNYTQIT